MKYIILPLLFLAFALFGLVITVLWFIYDPMAVIRQKKEVIAFHTSPIDGEIYWRDLLTDVNFYNPIGDWLRRYS